MNIGIKYTAKPFVRERGEFIHHSHHAFRSRDKKSVIYVLRIHDCELPRIREICVQKDLRMMILSDDYSTNELRDYDMVW